MYSALELTMKNNKRYQFLVEDKIAQAITKGHEKGGVFFAANGTDCMSVDFKDVVGITVKSFAESKPENKPISYTPRVVPRPEVAPKESANKALYKFECKCGADYFAVMFDDTKSCGCRECGERLYVDVFAVPGRVNGHGAKAILATNRYRVMADQAGAAK